MTVQRNTNISIDRHSKEAATSALPRSPSGGAIHGFTLRRNSPAAFLAFFLYQDGLILVFDPVDLSTVVVAPTTCSLLLVLTICKGLRFMPKIGRESLRFMPKMKLFRSAVYAWKTAPDHRHLWIKPPAKSPQEAPGARFSTPGTKGLPSAARESFRGEPWAGKRGWERRLAC